MDPNKSSKYPVLSPHLFNIIQTDLNKIPTTFAVPRAAVGISSSINSTEGSNTTEHESSSVTAVPARTSYNQTSSEVTSILPATNTTTLHPEHNITATPSSPISANSTAMPTSWPNSTTSETSENGNITDAGLTHISVGSTNQSFPWSTTSSMSVATNTTNPTLTENTTFTVSTIPHSPLEVPLGSHDGEMADQRLRVALGVVIPMSSLIMLGAFFAYCRQ